MTHAHPHDACGHAAVRDAGHLVLRHREPAAWIWPAAVLEPRAFERWHAGAMIAALLEPSGAR
jgi:hypothetical protein